MIKMEMITHPKTKLYMSKLPGMVREGLVSGVKDSINFGKDEAKNSFGMSGKPQNKTGKLSNSIKASFLAGINQIKGSLSSDEIYARIQEEGGTIRAKNSKYLTFQIGGSWVKVASVNIPARPYLHPAIMDNLRQIEAIIVASILKGVK
jgi:phage gpG-like protein